MATISIGYTDGANYYKSFIKSLFLSMYPENKCIFKGEPSNNPDILVFSLASRKHEIYEKSYKILIKTTLDDIKHIKADLIIDCINPDDRVYLPINTKMIYIPSYVLSFYERFKNGPNSLIKPSSFDAKQVFKIKTKFCAYLANRCDSAYRNKFFFVLSKYKQVDAIGKCFNKNKKFKSDRFYFKDGIESYHDRAVSKYRPYKFVICFESKKEKGYITNKIINAFLANCIPIYYGSDDVVNHFNPVRFINMNNYNQFEQCVKIVQELDTNDNKYIQMISQPCFVDNVLPSWFKLNLLAKTIKPLIKLDQVEIIDKTKTKSKLDTDSDTDSKDDSDFDSNSDSDSDSKDDSDSDSDSKNNNLDVDIDSSDYTDDDNKIDDDDDDRIN